MGRMPLAALQKEGFHDGIGLGNTDRFKGVNQFLSHMIPDNSLNMQLCGPPRKGVLPTKYPNFHGSVSACWSKGSEKALGKHFSTHPAGFLLCQPSPVLMTT